MKDYSMVIDVSKNIEVRKIWSELAEKFNKEVSRLYEIDEENERKAIARYSDPVINF